MSKGGRKIISSNTKIIISLVSLFFGVQSEGKVETQVRTLKEATHFDISGQKSGPWNYSVKKSSDGGGQVISVQFTSVTPEELQSLENFRDPRVQKIVVKTGVNNDALVDFYLADKMNFFDYQTESPNHLIFDIYSEEGVSKKTNVVATGPINSFVSTKSKDKKLQVRKPASVEKQINTPTDLNVLDVADKDYKRFNLDENLDSNIALIKSEQEIQLPFPELVTAVSPTLNDLNSNRLQFQISKEEGEENKIVRLMVRLFQEDKFAVALKTYSFFKEKYPNSKYEETLHLLRAEIFYRMWKKDKARVDFETAMTMYKEHVLSYPESPYRDKLSYFIGLSYFENGEYVEALSRFQSEIKENQKSSYFFSMRMAVAECLRKLNQVDQARETLEKIEADVIKEGKNLDIAAQARFRKGDVEFQAKNYDKAIQEYQAALKAYPKNTNDFPNAYYNIAESLFRQKKYKEALESFRGFAQKFPTHEYTSYATNRLAVLLEILGVPQDKVLGAYLESYYRYKGTPGSVLSKSRILLSRFKTMKPKEVDASVKEIFADAPIGKIESADAFAKLTVADGYFSRGEYSKAIEIYGRFYKENILSPYLSLFQKRIFRNFTDEMQGLSNKSAFMDIIQLYLKNKDTWLKGNSRVDTDIVIGKAYEQLNLYDEALKFYTSAESKIKALNDEGLRRQKIFEQPVSIESTRLRIAAVNAKLENIKAAAQAIHEIKNANHLSAEEAVEFSLISAQIAEKEGRIDVAIDQLKSLSTIWEKQPNLLLKPWLKIAKLYESKKNLPEAKIWIQKGVDLIQSMQTSESREEFVTYAADLLYKAGEFEKAINLYKDLLTHAVGNTAALKFKLGKIYFDRKQINEAKKIWAELKTDPTAVLWSKMADEHLAQYKWSEKFKRYVDRQPASGKRSGGQP